jgi:hypothetical protein
MNGTVVGSIDPALPALGIFFDPDRLSELFSRPLYTDRLRHKRGVSAVARLRRPGTGALEADPAPRWLAAYAPEHAPKLDRTLARAAAQGYDVELIELGDGHTLVAGPIGVDMKLHRTLRPFAGSEPLTFPPGAVLNYNPHRRVVFRLGIGSAPLVCKAGQADATEAAFLDGLAARGVPVLQRVEPHDAPAADGLRYYPWFGSGDLQQASRSHDPDVDRWALAAGAALASLHAQPPQVARPPAHGPLRKLQGLLERNASLLPAERARLTAIHATLVRRLGDGSAPVPVHGDFSADQVLVGPEGVLLADFDRSTTAPPGLDVGAFVAVDLLHKPSSGRPLRELFLAGYEEAGGRISEGTVLTWTAAHLLDRLNEPFRACSPRWREEMGDRLDLLEGLLQ